MTTGWHPNVRSNVSGLDSMCNFADDRLDQKTFGLKSFRFIMEEELPVALMTKKPSFSAIRSLAPSAVMKATPP